MKPFHYEKELLLKIYHQRKHTFTGVFKMQQVTR